MGSDGVDPLLDEAFADAFADKLADPNADVVTAMVYADVESCAVNNSDFADAKRNRTYALLSIWAISIGAAYIERQHASNQIIRIISSNYIIFINYFLKF